MGFFSGNKEEIFDPNDNIDVRNQIIKNFIDSDGKFRKPFENGSMSSFNLLGGDWNGYVNLVLTSVMADSLHSIELKMDTLIELEEKKLGINQQILEALKAK